jgi:hypothetical protein
VLLAAKLKHHAAKSLWCLRIFLWQALAGKLKYHGLKACGVFKKSA